MISVAYIYNGVEDSFFHDECSVFERYLGTCLGDVIEECNRVRVETQGVVLESEIMGGLDEDQVAFLESKNQNLLSKIGEKIIEIFNKFVEMVDKLIDKIKDIGFRTKNNEKKMEVLLKKHPELSKEKIKILCDQGGLDFTDMRSLSELDRQFEQIIEMSKKANVDPKSLKGRWDAAVKKFNTDNNPTMKAVRDTAAVVTAVVAAAIAIKTFRSKCVDSKKRIAESKDALDKLKREAYRSIVNDIDSPLGRETGIAQMKLAMYRELSGYHQKAIQRDASIINKMNSAIAAFIDNAIDSGAAKAVLGQVHQSFHSDMEHIANKFDRRDREANLREFEKGYYNTVGRNNADNTTDPHRVL